VADIGDRIRFYGLRPIEWFDEFYRDKDIILSPNIPSAIFPGSFDGFPTAACIDAGLRKTAVFCTDELRLNLHFADGEDIVVVPRDASAIAAILERYYREPDRLARLADNGCRKMREIFNLEAQMGPRLALLRQEIEMAVTSRRAIRAEMNHRANLNVLHSPTRFLGDMMVRLCVSLSRNGPSWLRNGARSALRAVRANEALLRAIWRFCPEPVLGFYRRVRESLRSGPQQPS
jgi:hypothetical protein